jgi:hypothetical protein
VNELILTRGKRTVKHENDRPLRLAKVSRLLVRLDRVTHFIVNADHGIM